MADLIEREALLESVRKWIVDTSEIRDSLDRQYNKGLLRAIKEIQRAPAINAEPVRHGQWKYDTNANDWGIGGYVCSECGAKNNNLPCNKVANLMMFVGSNYCPHCGARRDG